MHQTRRGFTLIELLVVIAIIGILSSVVLASLNSARSRANDAKRYSDLHQIALALEMYYDANGGAYPAYSSSIAETDLATVLAPNFISRLPTDPVHTGGYGYRYCASGSVYTLLAYTDKNNYWCTVSTGYDPCTWAQQGWPTCGR